MVARSLISIDLVPPSSSLSLSSEEDSSLESSDSDSDSDSLSTSIDLLRVNPSVKDTKLVNSKNCVYKAIYFAGVAYHSYMHVGQ